MSLIIIFSLNLLHARIITYYRKPVKIYKGSIFFLIFEDLDDDKDYYLEVKTKKSKRYELYQVNDYTLKLIGVPLNAPNKIKISLFEDDELILEEEIRVYNKEVGELQITVKDEHVTPPKELQERIWKEYSLKQKAKKKIIKKRYFKKSPTFPLKKYRLSTPFGYKRVFNKKKVSIHYGTDISAKKGTPVYAPYNGKVILKGDFHYSGKSIYLHHGDDMISFYCHLSKINVKKNQFVKKGQKIGEVGSTGRSTGPHLHLSFYINRIAVDPMSIFKLLTVK